MLEVNDFDAIRIGLASAEQIRSWSYGEVLKPETINYRTLKPERDGLFCERTFGPTKDWECACGKYKRITYKGIICDKCGVEVTRTRVRRERMGHVELATPVTHIWYVKGTPSRLGQLLDISPRNLEKIIYFASFIVTELDEKRRAEAIASIDDDHKTRLDETAVEVEDMIESLDDDLERQILEIRARFDNEAAQLPVKVEEDIQKLRTETDVVLRVLAENKSQKAPDDIKLSWMLDPIVTTGTKITARHSKGVEPAFEEASARLREQLEEERKDLDSRRETDISNERVRVEDQRSRSDETLKERLTEVDEYYERRLIDLETLASRQLLSELRYQELQGTCGDVFKATSGAEAMLELIGQIDLDELAVELRADLGANSIQKRRKATKRLRVVEAFRRSGNQPDWMIISVLPVLPPDLRPMVQLDGGRFATSDLNDLYRRVINRNNRLKRLIELGAPEIIVRNEKRMLQEAVDALVDNGRRGRPITGSGSHPYKSLSDLLRGKQGRFRQNLLGKRVDYSGRSVIVVGPDLKLDECGLPTRMALELFKPFVMRRLVDYELASNIKSAKRVVERADPEVWDILEEVTRNHPILLNRAPTLHRLGIQAFSIRLVQGSAIQIHPLVCFSYNADFDGDQMAVHVPLSMTAQEEARRLMMSSRNLLSPADGSPVIGPTKDMILGCYYLTLPPVAKREHPRVFTDGNEVSAAFEAGLIDLHEEILMRANEGEVAITEERPDGALFTTSAGRVFFGDILPPEARPVESLLDKGQLKDLITDIYYDHGSAVCAQVADDLMTIGFHWATRSGVTMAMADLTIPPIKGDILNDTEDAVEKIEDQFNQGIVTEQERYNLHVRSWAAAMKSVSEAVEDGLDPLGPVYLMGASGSAKGNFDQIRQIAGMRGLMTDPNGRVIEMPVRSNFREGLSVFEYFISTHGARKGLADTALRTAESGYLTRRLVDVSQDTIVTMEDCGTPEGLEIIAGAEFDYGDSIASRAFGRVLMADVVDPDTGEILVRSGEIVGLTERDLLEEREVTTVTVRTVMQCRAERGICQRCYGYDLARNEHVELGTAVGIIAAQSIGEPATQLTMRTFHTGGTYRTDDITRGLPRVEEIFEARVPKGQAVMAEMDGDIDIVHEEESIFLRLKNSKVQKQEVDIPPGYKSTVVSKKIVSKGDVIAEFVGEEEPAPPKKATKKSKSSRKSKASKIVADGSPILADLGGIAKVTKKKVVISSEATDMLEYPISHSVRLHVQSGDEVVKGQQLTEGSLNPHDVLRVRGDTNLQRYLLNEIQGTYRVVGVPVSDKHVEIVIRQMLRKVLIEDAGDTELLPGELVDKMRWRKLNDEAIEGGGKPASSSPVLLGVTKASLNTESFLAAASFQDTTRVLTEAALQGSTDRLRGLKENVIIGKLIPAGTGKGHGRFSLLSAFQAMAEADELRDGEAGAALPDGEGNGAAATTNGDGESAKSEADANGKSAAVASDESADSADAAEELEDA
ncbi:MAG: DNA-directed RNA polymerase subunit beta' [Chloroflexota bacterium]|jgi:DNA-directed RNA polymerase subunit beta'|nr:DNA-directed RNA polymerase subunit beta' [Chloroflexota bacterium]MDP6757681.1 DNA-directed RNA polymerase subunit beta' [Chloroflexota bacterium]